MRPQRELDVREENEALVPRVRHDASERGEVAGDQQRADGAIRGGFSGGSVGGRGGRGHDAGHAQIQQPATWHAPRRDRAEISQNRVREAEGRGESFPEAGRVVEVPATKAPKSGRDRDQRPPNTGRDIDAAEDEGAQLRGRVADGSLACLVQRSSAGLASSRAWIARHAARVPLSPPALAPGQRAQPVRRRFVELLLGRVARRRPHTHADADEDEPG